MDVDAVVFDGAVWRCADVGLRFRLVGVRGECALLVEDMADEGVAWWDFRRQFSAKLSVRIPVVWWEGVGQLEHERAEFTGVRPEDQVPLSEEQLEIMFAMVVYAARDLSIGCGSFTQRLAALAPA